MKEKERYLALSVLYYYAVVCVVVVAFAVCVCCQALTEQRANTGAQRYVHTHTTESYTTHRELKCGA